MRKGIIVWVRSGKEEGGVVEGGIVGVDGIVDDNCVKVICWGVEVVGVECEENGFVGGWVEIGEEFGGMIGGGGDEMVGGCGKEGIRVERIEECVGGDMCELSIERRSVEYVMCVDYRKEGLEGGWCEVVIRRIVIVVGVISVLEGEGG